MAGPGGHGHVGDTRGLRGPDEQRGAQAHLLRLSVPAERLQALLHRLAHEGPIALRRCHLQGAGEPERIEAGVVAAELLQDPTEHLPGVPRMGPEGEQNGVRPLARARGDGQARALLHFKGLEGPGDVA